LVLSLSRWGHLRAQQEFARALVWGKPNGLCAGMRVVCKSAGCDAWSAGLALA
jgi:hypothetical protein